MIRKKRDIGETMPATELVRINVQAALEERNISQSALCRDTGMSLSSLNEFLNGKKPNVAVASIERIARAIGIDLVDLFRKPE